MLRWRQKNSTNSKLLKSILVTIIFGFLVGFFATSNISKELYEVTTSDKSHLKMFINSFTLHYWYFFILWVSGLFAFGFIVGYFITFFKSFMMGVLFGILIKANAIVGILSFFKYGVWEIVLLFPILLYASYKSIGNAWNGNKTYLQKGEAYFNVLIKITVVIVIYSILIGITQPILEVNL